MINEALDRRVWVQPGELAEQIKVNCNKADNTVAVRILPERQRWRSIIRDFSTCSHFAALPHFKADILDSKLLKGAKTHHRKLMTWGELRVSSIGRASLDRASLELQSFSSIGKASLDQASLDILDDTKFFTDLVTVKLIIKIGILREPGDFVKQMANGGHSRVLPHAGTREMNELIPANLPWDTEGLISLRIELFDKCLKRAQDLAENESKLHDGLCSSVIQLWSGKGQAEEVSKLHDGLCSHATQVLREEGLLLLRNLSGALSKPTVKLQHATLGKVVGPEDSELHEAAWEETRLEEERGVILSDDSGVFKGKIIARCFRSRLDHIMSDVYNSKQCGLNDACSLHEIFALNGEKFILHGIDRIAAMLIGPWCSAFFDDFPTWRQRLSWQRHTLTLSLAKRE